MIPSNLRFLLNVVALTVLCLLALAGAALNAPSATLTITETSRSASASGGPFFIPNQTPPPSIRRPTTRVRPALPVVAQQSADS